MSKVHSAIIESLAAASYSLNRVCRSQIRMTDCSGMILTTDDAAIAPQMTRTVSSKSRWWSQRDLGRVDFEVFDVCVRPFDIIYTQRPGFL